MNDVHEMNDNNGSNKMTSHKEEHKARIDAVNKDRENIQRKLSICIDPY